MFVDGLGLGPVEPDWADLVHYGIVAGEETL